MNELIVPDEYKSTNPFLLPFRADADRVVDKDGRVVCSISSDSSPEEAIKIAKLFSSAAESLAFLNDISSLIENLTKDTEGYNHGAENEDKANCLICNIQDYINSVLS